MNTNGHTTKRSGQQERPAPGEGAGSEPGAFFHVLHSILFIAIFIVVGLPVILVAGLVEYFRMSFNFDKYLMCDRCGTYLEKYPARNPQSLKRQLQIARARGWLLESAEGCHYCPTCRKDR